MTDITCYATTCKYNSAPAYDSEKGTCLLKHIDLSINENKDYDFKCNYHIWDLEKPVKENDIF